MINIEDLAIQIQEIFKDCYNNGYKDGSVNSLRNLGKALIIARDDLIELSSVDLVKALTEHIIPGAIKQAQDRFQREDVGNGHGKKI